MRKKPFLLFEILIALSLMAMLLSLLFSFMVQSIRIDKKMEKARALILEREHLQVRLADLFMTLHSNTLHPALYTQSFPKETTPSLVLFFDNGIDPDPQFSGTLLGRLYLEKENLCFVYWPNDPAQAHSWRKEILLRNVSSMDFQFLTAKDTSLPPHAQTFWHTSWPKEKGGYPSIVRMRVQQKGFPLQFAFRLPYSYPIPSYGAA